MEIKGFIIMMFFLLSSKLVSSGNSSEECNPIYCGAMKLASPFHVAGKHCGLPRFNVSCQHNSTLLINLSGDTYIIKTISYENRTFRIVNSAFSRPIFECPKISSIHNLTLNTTTLTFKSKPRKFVLLQDCSTEALKGINYTQIICRKSSYTNSSVSLVRNLKWKELAGECRFAVSVPYEDVGASNSEDLIMAGITLKWSTDHTSDHQTTDSQTKDDQTTDSQTKDDQTSFAGKIVTVVVGLIVLMFVYGIVYCIMRCCRQIIKSGKKCAMYGTQTAKANRNLERFFRHQESIAPKRYSYTEINVMTNFLRKKLGEGGYSVVYKGKLMCGRPVAVKLLKQSRGDGQDFMNEVASVSGANHVNVVSLLGFCFEGSKRCLVYEFMRNGSLEKYRLARNDNSSTPPLTWETWFQISLGIARGLEYLHRGCNTRILHFDIKPHNILLGENFYPKISDFGLAKLCPQTERNVVFMSEARGTVGYIAPEVFCRNYGEVSHKSDVYSYGMLVLEVIGCRENANANANANTSSSEYFPEWVYKQLNRDQEQEDDEMGIHEEGGSLKRKMTLVSLWCIQTCPSDRPSMDRVVQMLEGSLDWIEPLRFLLFQLLLHLQGCHQIHLSHPHSPSIRFLREQLKKGTMTTRRHQYGDQSLAFQ